MDWNYSSMKLFFSYYLMVNLDISSFPGDDLLGDESCSWEMDGLVGEG